MNFQRHPKQPVRPDADVDESDTSALPPPLTPQNVQPENVANFPLTSTPQHDPSDGANVVSVLDIPISESACTLMASKITTSIEEICSKIKLPSVQIRGIMEITSDKSDGVEIIKKTLLSWFKC